ncbi:hypothetical protein V8F20_001235 [Naviculisporaceae sp. PSN 640]
MAKTLESFFFLPLLYMVLSTVTAQEDGLVTIYEYPTFSSLRQCAQNCFVITAYTTRDLLGPKLRCSVSTLKSSKLAMNNCYCRPDLRTDAHELLSSCVGTKCPFNENDISTAQFLYDSYCSSNGYNYQQVPQPTSGGGNGGGSQGGDGSAAPGATKTGSQTAPTGSFKSAGNSLWTIPLQPFLISVGMVIAIHIFEIII